MYKCTISLAIAYVTLEQKYVTSNWGKNPFHFIQNKIIEIWTFVKIWPTVKLCTFLLDLKMTLE